MVPSPDSDPLGYEVTSTWGSWESRWVSRTPLAMWGCIEGWSLACSGTDQCSGSLEKRESIGETVNLVSNQQVGRS